MTNTAELGIKIFLDDTASSGLNAIDSLLGTLGRTISSAGYAWAALSPGMRLAAEVAAGAGIDFMAFSSALETTIEDAASLEDTMARVQIAFNASDDQMQVMTDTLQQVAGQSRFSTQEIGDGFAQLGERGFTVAEVIKDQVGQAMVNLAEATGSQTVPAADLLASTMQIFSAKASDAEKYASGLTFAFHDGIPSIAGLSSAMDEVGQEAALLHIPLDQVIVTLDYLVRSGIPAAESANSLRYMLQSLTDPTNKAAEALANLGILTINQTSPAFKSFEKAMMDAGSALISTSQPFDGTLRMLSALFTEANKLGVLHTDQSFYQWATSLGILSSKLYDAHGNFKDLFSIINLLGTAMTKLNPEQKQEVLSQLFNVRSGKGASDLMNNIDQVMARLHALDASYQQFVASDGAARDASKLTSDYNGRLSELRTTIKSVSDEIGKTFLHSLEGLFAWLNDLIAPLQFATSGFPQLAAMFLLTGTVLSGLTLVITLFLVVFGFFGQTLGLIVEVSLGVAVGIAAISAGIALLVTHINQVLPLLSSIGIALFGAAVVFGAFQLVIHAKAIASLIQLGAAAVRVGILIAINLTNSFLASIPAAMEAAAAWILANGSALLLGAGIVLLVALLAGAVIGFVLLMQHTGGLNALLKAGQTIWKELQTLWQNFVAAIMPALKQAFEQIKPSISDLVKAFNETRPALIFLGQILGGVLVVALGVLIGLIHGLASALAELIKGLAQVLTGIVQVISGILQFFLGFFSVLHGMFTNNQNEIAAGWGRMNQGIISIVTGLVNIVVGLFRGFFGAILGFVAGFITGVVNFFQHLFEVLVGHSIVPDLISSIIRWFLLLPGQVLNNLTGFIAGIVGKFIDLRNQIVSILANLGSILLNSGRNLMIMLGNGIANGIHWVIQQATNVANTVRNLLGFHSPTKEGPLADSDQYMPNMMKMYAAGISSNTHLLHGALTTAANALRPGGFISPSTQAAQSYASFAASGGQGATTTFNLVIDGKQVSQVVLDRMTGQLKMNGAGRMLK